MIIVIVLRQLNHVERLWLGDGANGMKKLTPINIDVSQAYQLISIININSIERYVFWWAQWANSQHVTQKLR